MLAASGLHAQKPPDSQGGSKSKRPYLGRPCEFSDRAPLYAGVERLLILSYDGRIINRGNLNLITDSVHKKFIQEIVCLMASSRVNPLGEMVQRLDEPVTVEFGHTCEGGHYDFTRRRIAVLFMPGTCTGDDPFRVFYHELGHAVFSDQVIRNSSRKAYQLLAESLGSCHDESIFDRADGSLLLAMDARTSPFHALDEGLADGMAIALTRGPFASVMAVSRGSGNDPIQNLIVEVGSPAWIEKPWLEQQANEWFVVLLIWKYLGASEREIIAGLNRLTRVRGGPMNMEEFLTGLAQVDPGGKEKINGLLDELNAGWRIP